MILGVGIDLCRISRIRHSVDRLGETWIGEIFTKEERAQCTQCFDSAIAFTQGFACKEAVAKALGSGFASGVRPRDILLTNDRGMWRVELDGSARRRLLKITPPGYVPSFHVTSTTTATFVSCLVVIDTVARLSVS